MDVDTGAEAQGNVIAISRQQFTISDALAVYFLRKDARFHGLFCMDTHDAVPERVIAAVTNGELRISASGQDRPLFVYEKQLKDRYLKLGGGYLKLSSAGSAFGFCLATPLERTIREKFPRRTDKQISGDVRHIYQAVVEVVDTENCRALQLLEARTELSQCAEGNIVDLLERVKEIADFLKQKIGQRGLTNDGFVAIAEETIRLIGIEYENVLDWFLDEGLPTWNNLWAALNDRSSR
ncbi:hypothetical protein AAVH_22653 [Aphelenchoides avenae]|nr:hypothetical protein AAVH_22653 [Aphelenchus avenae]